MREKLGTSNCIRKKRVIAVCGKGGVGKTAFTTMMTRNLIESSMAGNLLVIDADPAMGLPNTLGLNVDRTIGQVREKIIDIARSGSGEDRLVLSKKIDYHVFETLVESEDMAFLAMGRTDSQGCFCSVNEILKKSIEILERRFDTILIDGEAGLEQINRQVIDKIDILIILTDTSARGMETVRHIKNMIEEQQVIQCEKLGVVFNRVNGNQEFLYQAAAKMEIDVLGMIPQDENIVNFDMHGEALNELPADSPALVAVKSIVEKLICIK